MNVTADVDCKKFEASNVGDLGRSMPRLYPVWYGGGRIATSQLGARGKSLLRGRKVGYRTIGICLFGIRSKQTM